MVVVHTSRHLFYAFIYNLISSLEVILQIYEKLTLYVYKYRSYQLIIAYSNYRRCQLRKVSSLHKLLSKLQIEHAIAVHAVVASRRIGVSLAMNNYLVVTKT